MAHDRSAASLRSPPPGRDHWTLTAVSTPKHRQYFPDFLIVGPQRTGTTWLHHHLRRHPQVFMSNPKELYFFNCLNGADKHYYYRPKNSPRCDDINTYVRRFHDTPYDFLRKSAYSLSKFREFYRPCRRGEATAHYAVLPAEVISSIVTIQPSIKIIILLRDVVDRAWSHAKKRLVRKTGRSLEAVKDEEFFAFFDKPYQQACGDYRSIVETWQSMIPPQQIFFGLYERIQSNPDHFFMDVLKFLDVRADQKYFDQ